MPVSHIHKLILVHIPKTGGTSIEAALGMHAGKKDIGVVLYKRQSKDYCHLYGSGMQHMNLAEIKDYFSKINFNDYRSFGGIKHAIDVFFDLIGHKDSLSRGDKLFDSYFKLTVVRNPYARLVSHFSWMDGKWRKNIESDKNEFKLFVNDMIRNKLYKTDLHLIPQYKYVVIDGEMAADSILKQENLNEEFSSVCNKLGVNLELKKRMVSKHADFSEYYTDDIRKKVYDIYRKDFELFGYDENINGV